LFDFYHGKSADFTGSLFDGMGYLHKIYKMKEKKGNWKAVEGEDKTGVGFEVAQLDGVLTIAVEDEGEKKVSLILDKPKTKELRNFLNDALETWESEK
jgi:hypothetical protein